MIAFEYIVTALAIVFVGVKVIAPVFRKTEAERELEKAEKQLREEEVRAKAAETAAKAEALRDKTFNERIK